MFLDEARIASRITHPNVCSVFDFGEARGEHYIAMEYLLGEPLSRVHRARASALPAVAPLTRTATDPVQAGSARELDTVSMTLPGLLTD